MSSEENAEERFRYRMQFYKVNLPNLDDALTHEGHI